MYQIDRKQVAVSMRAARVQWSDDWMGSTSMHWRNRPGLSRLPEATVFSALGLGSQSAHSKQSVGILLQSSVTRWNSRREEPTERVHRAGE